MTLINPDIFLNIFFIFPQIAILAICIYFVVKKPCAESFLLVSGNFIGVLVTIFHVVVIPIFSDRIYSASNMGIFNITRGASFVGSILFAVGLILLVINTVKSNQKAKQGF
jgi:hypothetical protein